jgi:hypothetical protein
MFKLAGSGAYPLTNLRGAPFGRARLQVLHHLMGLWRQG